MTGLDPDTREEAWRLYESAHLTMAALGGLEPLPDSFFGRKLQTYRSVSERLEKRWGFKSTDVRLPT